jgi:hypothetical protein
MTDERAKEIAADIRARNSAASAGVGAWNDDDMFLLKLYDDIQAIKAALAATAFIHGGIKPVTKVDAE